MRQRLVSLETMALVVKTGHLDTFELLSEEVGLVDSFIASADKDAATDGYTASWPSESIGNLIEALAQPERTVFLRAVLDDALFPSLTAGTLQLCLAHVLEADTVSGVTRHQTIELLLSKGASIRGLQRREWHRACPLVQAILCRWYDMAESLLRYGADIRGTERRPNQMYSVNNTPALAAMHRASLDGPLVMGRFAAWGAEADLELYPEAVAELQESICIEKKRRNDETGFYNYMPPAIWDPETPFDPLFRHKSWMGHELFYDDAQPRLDLGSDGGRHEKERNSLAVHLLTHWGPHRLKDDRFHTLMLLLKEDLTADGMWMLRHRLTRYGMPEGIASERLENLFEHEISGDAAVVAWQEEMWLRQFRQRTLDFRAASGTRDNRPPEPTPQRILLPQCCIKSKRIV